MLLAETILKLDGNKLTGYKDVCCPRCSSNIIAGLGYTIRGKHYQDIAVIHNPSEEDALVYSTHGMWIDYGDPRSKNGDHVAYICLKCGKEFGWIEYPPELDELYRKHSEE